MFAQINDATREREEKLMDSYQERTFLQPTRVLSARTLHGCVTYDGESFSVLKNCLGVKIGHGGNLLQHESAFVSCQKCPIHMCTY